MIDANDLINRLKKEHYKTGYTLDERDEFKLVYNTLNSLGVDTSNFISHLQTLTILKENDPNSEISGYNPKTNTINYANEEHILHELFHMASYKKGEQDSGIVVVEDGYRGNYALNEGITDFCTKMAKNDSVCSYPFEMLVAQSLSYIFGDGFLKAYFNNSYEEFINSFPELIRIDIIDILSNLDEYNDLTQSIYSGDFFPEDIESVREISENILSSLYDICEYGIRNQEGLTELLQKSADTNDMKQIVNIVNINSFLDNLPSKGL